MGVLPLLLALSRGRPQPGMAQSGGASAAPSSAPTSSIPGGLRGLPIGIQGAPNPAASGPNLGNVMQNGTPQTMQPPQQGGGGPWGNGPMPPWFLNGVLGGWITNSQMPQNPLPQLPNQNSILQSLFQLGLGGNQQFYAPQQGTPMSPSGPVTGGMNPMLGSLGMLLNLANGQGGGGGITTMPVARTPQPGGAAPAPSPRLPSPITPGNPRQPIEAPGAGPVAGGGMPIRTGAPVFGNRML